MVLYTHLQFMRSFRRPLLVLGGVGVVGARICARAEWQRSGILFFFLGGVLRRLVVSLPQGAVLFQIVPWGGSRKSQTKLYE